MFVLFRLSVAGVCAAAAVCRGHRGSDQTDVSHASDPSSETDFSGGLQILRCCAQVTDYLNECTHTHASAHTNILTQVKQLLLYKVPMHSVKM